MDFAPEPKPKVWIVRMCETVPNDAAQGLFALFQYVGPGFEHKSYIDGRHWAQNPSHIPPQLLDGLLSKPLQPSIMVAELKKPVCQVFSVDLLNQADSTPKLADIIEDGDNRQIIDEIIRNPVSYSSYQRHDAVKRVVRFLAEEDILDAEEAMRVSFTTADLMAVTRVRDAVNLSVDGWEFTPLLAIQDSAWFCEWSGDLQRSHGAYICFSMDTEPRPWVLPAPQCAWKQQQSFKGWRKIRPSLFL